MVMRLTDVETKNGLFVLERMHTHLFVSVIIEIKCLSDQILSVSVSFSSLGISDITQSAH
jgi:hypothetical protein